MKYKFKKTIEFLEQNKDINMIKDVIKNKRSYSNNKNKKQLSN